MIITTRYRDISCEEAMKCTTNPIDNAEVLWARQRGNPVRLITPPRPAEPWEWACHGPFYENADYPNQGVCIHWVEIGD